jgi:Spy/CpxP family protein refolding chaperone
MSPAAQNPKVITTLVLVFLAGAGAGAVGMRLGLDDRIHRVKAASLSTQLRPTGAAQRAPYNRDLILQKFRTELDLTPDQTQAVASVLGDYRHYYQNLQDQLEDVRSTGKSRIMQILNPDQKQKFDHIMAELQPQLETK